MTASGTAAWEGGAQVRSSGPGLHLPKGSRLPAFERAPRAAAFLDRDGVLVEDVHFLTDPAGLRLLPAAASGLRLLAPSFLLIVVTNQSGVARGLLSEDRLLEIHTALVAALAEEGAALDAIYYCPHLPDAPLDAYRAQCDCRKPRPGMLLRARDEWGLDLRRSFLIGDRPRDVAAAAAAGVTSVLLGPGAAEAAAGPHTADLAAAAGWILARAGARRSAGKGRES